MLAAGTASGACLAPSGPKILARDLVPAFAEFSTADPEASVAYAPIAGVRRTLTVGEIARAAQRAGVSLEHPAEVCFEWPLAPLSTERVVAALRQAVGDESAEVEVTERMNGPVPAGKLEFANIGGTNGSTAAPLWRGRIEYGSDQDFRIWVRARVRVRQPRVIALEALPARQVIQPSQVKLQEALVEVTEANVATSLDQVVGKIPRTNLAAGANVAVNVLDTPNAIERGDRVKLRAADAGATITTEATAEGSGRRGDTIMVRNVSSGRLIRARIEDRGLVVLAAQGGIH
jgi:flagella basal body P-ring formation protein FlgA